MKPSNTPATVACTPEACTSAQATMASGTSNHQDVTRLCTSRVNSAIRDEASQRGDLEVVGVEEGNDGDGHQVIYHCQGEQEGAQR